MSAAHVNFKRTCIRLYDFSVVTPPQQTPFHSDLAKSFAFISFGYLNSKMEFYGSICESFLLMEEI